MVTKKTEKYYLPEPSHWPIVGSIGLFVFFMGFAHWLHNSDIGPMLFGMGLLIIVYMIVGWFRTVIQEDVSGVLHSEKVDRSFRWGMIWFIFSEVMFFGAFFGALFYARVISVPWLGEEWGTLTHIVLWPNFAGRWPVFHPPDPTQFSGPESVMNPWGIPALNTLILLSSGVTVTIAHWGLLKNKRRILNWGLAATIALGASFIMLQAHEYWEAYNYMGLTLNSGIYGTTFFMLTGFHGAHVTVGTIMLCTILGRCLKGHFDSHHHFAFEAVSWYWHFVDVVWLFLFVFVYWL